jgi:hypothetical protein
VIENQLIISLQNKDSFLVLKSAERLAVSIAKLLALKRSSQPGATKRSFQFPGHCRLCSETDILQHARQLVLKLVAMEDPSWHCTFIGQTSGS